MPSDAEGFTLVEVLVALVVSAILLAILMNGATTARMRVQATDERKAAIALAGSLIERAAAEPLTMPAAQQGQSGKLHWTIERVQVASEPRRLVALMAWRVTVYGANGNRLISVPTRRLVTAVRS